MKVCGIFNSNVYILGDENVVLIDAGAELDALKNVIQDKKVKAVFLTHGHFDHMFYIEDYIKEYDCKVYASINAKEYIEDASKNQSKSHWNKQVEVKDFKNFVWLSGDGEIDLGDFKIKYFQIAGHTDSDMLYIVDRDLYCGDTILGEYVGRCDLFGGNIPKLKNSLKKITELDFDFLYGGHGERQTKEDADRVAKRHLD